MKKILDKVLDFLPIPFWVYFLSILAGNVGLLPHETPVYDWITRHVLPVAIILMLIGTPLPEMVTLGPKAMAAMAVGTGTIFFAQVAAYVLLIRYLPADAWKSVGALMGTWIGGSANMVAVKEILQMPDSNLGVLVIVDAFLSYTWMALLLVGARFQSKFDKPGALTPGPSPRTGEGSPHSLGTIPSPLGGEGQRVRGFIVLVVGFVIGEICVHIGKFFSGLSSLLPINGWILLTASTAAILLALTPLRNLKKWGAPKVGTLCLYLVLVTIGAKTILGGARLQAPAYLIYGILTFLIHGALSLGLGRMFKLPLFLLSTASQANIGGAVSAPIVAEAYQPGTAHIGVLMAVLGAVLGTYLGVAGGYLCRLLSQILR